MVRITIRALAMLVLLLAGSHSYAQDGMALMKIEPGARPAGMGGAFVAINGDPMSPIYNPAGAVGESDFVAGFSHSEHWENINIETGYASGKVRDNLFLFGGIRYGAVSFLERRTQPNAEAIGYFDPHEVSFKGGVAYQISEKLTAGVALGWFVQKIAIYSGSAMNFDFGLTYKLSEALQIAASGVNLGSDFELSGNELYLSDPIAIPKIYRFGGAYYYSYFRGALDMVIIDDNSHLHVGGEYEAANNFALRAGYMSGYDTKNITAGMSIKAPNYGLTIDYAFIPYTGNLGSTHQFSLSYGLL